MISLSNENRADIGLPDDLLEMLALSIERAFNGDHPERVLYSLGLQLSEYLEDRFPKWRIRMCEEEKGSISQTEAEEVLRNFHKKLLESQKELPPEAIKVLEENFWDLVGGSDSEEKALSNK